MTDVPANALKDRDVLSKTRAVLAYDRDESREGRPLTMLLGGAFVSLVAIVLIFVVAYRTWWLHEVARTVLTWPSA